MEDDWVSIEVGRPPGLPIRSASNLGQDRDALMVKPLDLYECMRTTARRNLADHKSPMFHVDIGALSLYEVFLSKLPSSHQQEYSCTLCQHFFSRYGNLALVNDAGELLPLFWDPSDTTLPTLFQPAVQEVSLLFEDQKVTKEFKVTEKTQLLGHGQRGGFHHMMFTFPDRFLHKEEVAGFTSITASEGAAMLEKVLSEYKIGTVKRTKNILEEKKLRLADNHLGAIRWLYQVYTMDLLGAVKVNKTARHNLLYRLAASAFTGCLKQLRSGALAVLLDDVKASRSLKSMKLQWNKIVCPTEYMRPKARPRAGNIKAAERLFEKLGLTKHDTRRRYLRPGELRDDVYIWQPHQAQKPKGEGIFGDVIPREKTNPKAPTTEDPPANETTFAKFINEILPRAKKLEYWLGQEKFIYFLITGLEGTKPLMQWHVNDTNLVSWYTDSNLTKVEQASLLPNAWNEVTAILPFPHLWDAMPLVVTFPLQGADDNNAVQNTTEEPAKEGSEGKDATVVAEDQVKGNANTEEDTAIEFSDEENTKDDSEEKLTTVTQEHHEKGNADQEPNAAPKASQSFKYYHKKNGFRYLFCFRDVKEYQENRSLCLFPTLLKSEFHAVRSTIESFSNTGEIEDAGGPMVGGVEISRGEQTANYDHLVRVTRFDGVVKVWRIASFE